MPKSKSLVSPNMTRLLDTQAITGFKVNTSRENTDLQNNKSNPNFVYISYDLLIPNKNNVYPITNLNGLANLINAFGLMQPLVVKPIENGSYKIIGGHRRYYAIKMLIEERGLEKFKEIECILCDIQNESEADETLRLHAMNIGNRELSEYDKMTVIVDLNENIQKKRKEGTLEFQGATRDLIADFMGLSDTQIQTYITIANNADDSILTDLKDQKITLTKAWELTKELMNVKNPKRYRASSQKLSYELIESDLRNVFGTKVYITNGKKKGTISIEYYGNEHFDNLILQLRSAGNLSSYISDAQQNIIKEDVK